MAGQPADDLQPRVGRSSGKPWSERKKWIWWDGAKWTGYDVPDFAGDQTADRTRPKPGAIGLDAHSGTDAFIMKARRRRLALRADRAGGRAAADAIRAGRVAGAAIRSTSSSRARCSSTGRIAANPLAPVGGSEVPLRDHHVPAHRALPVRRDEPLAAVARRAAARAVRRDQPRARAGERHRRISTGCGVSSRERRSARRPWSPGACARCRSTGKRSIRSACRGTGATRASSTGDVVNELTALVGDPERDDSRRQGLRVQRRRRRGSWP